MRPDWCPQRVWDEAVEVAVGQEWAHPLVLQAIARAILAAEQREREACLTACLNELAQAKANNCNQQAMGAHWCATAIRNRTQEPS